MLYFTCLFPFSFSYFLFLPVKGKGPSEFGSHRFDIHWEGGWLLKFYLGRWLR